jgi:hypothetical protein
MGYFSEVAMISVQRISDSAPRIAGSIYAMEQKMLPGTLF